MIANLRCPQALHSNRSLTLLDLRHNSLKDTGVNLLLRALGRNCGLHKLHLASNDLHGGGLGLILSHAMHTNTSLLEIDLLDEIDGIARVEVRTALRANQLASQRGKGAASPSAAHGTREAGAGQEPVRQTQSTVTLHVAPLASHEAAAASADNGARLPGAHASVEESVAGNEGDEWPMIKALQMAELVMDKLAATRRAARPAATVRPGRGMDVSTDATEPGERSALTQPRTDAGAGSSLSCELAEVLQSLGIGSSLGAALTWCESQSVQSLKAVKSRKLETHFASALKLRQGSKLRLIARLRRTACP